MSSFGKCGDKRLIELVDEKLKALADKARSDDRNINSIAKFDRWLELHRLAIGFLIEAEQYNCPVRTQTLFDISDALDESALPTDFYKRLVLIYRKVKLAGNRRIKNQFRDAIIQAYFKRLRVASLWSLNEGKEDVLLQFKHGDALILAAELFNLSVKSIEKILSKNIDGVDRSVMKEGKDFERFWIEAMKIEAKKNKTP